jgi:hypothetical protein
MKTNPFNPSNNPIWRITQTRTGNRIRLTLVLVRFISLPRYSWDCRVRKRKFTIENTPLCILLEFRTNKPSDVISTLVSIYDSKDLFVKELQVLLAQRLLAITKDNSDRVEREVCIFYLPFVPFDDLLFAEEKCRNLENPIWRSSSTSMRSDVEGYDRFEAN